MKAYPDNELEKLLEKNVLQKILNKHMSLPSQRGSNIPMRGENNKPISKDEVGEYIKKLNIKRTVYTKREQAISMKPSSEQSSILSSYRPDERGGSYEDSFLPSNSLGKM